MRVCPSVDKEHVENKCEWRIELASVHRNHCPTENQDGGDDQQQDVKRIDAGDPVPHEPAVARGGHRLVKPCPIDVEQDEAAQHEKDTDAAVAMTGERHGPIVIAGGGPDQSVMEMQTPRAA